MKKFLVIIGALILVSWVSIRLKEHYIYNNAGDYPCVTAEYASLSELNEKYAVNLAHPAVPGVTNEEFLGLEMKQYGIAEYSFSLNGYDYSFRASADTHDDISGFFVKGTPLFDVPEMEDAEPNVNVSTAYYKVSRWFIGDTQYVLVVHDGGEMDAALFVDIAAEMEAITAGRQVAEMDGVEAIVFTAGIGENGKAVRKSICESLSFLGIEFDEVANDCRGKEVEISKPGSKVRVFVIPTNEELMIARDTKEIVCK